MENQEIAQPETNAKTARRSAENAYINVRRLSNDLRKAWEAFGYEFRNASSAHSDIVEFTRWCRKHLPGLTEEHLEALKRIAEHNYDEDAFLRNAEGVLLADPRSFWREYEKWMTGAHIPIELRGIVVRHTVSLDDKATQRVARLVTRARKSLPSSESAKQSLRALATEHGTTVEALEAAVVPHDPHRAPELRRVSVETRIAVEDIVDDAVRQMVIDGQDYQSIKRRLGKALDGFEGIAKGPHKDS